MSRDAWELTPERFQVLARHARAEKPFTTACKALSAHHVSVRRACIRNGLGSWLNIHFPSRQGQGAEQKSKMDGKLRRFTPEHFAEPVPVPDSPQVKWLTRSWSKAA